MRKNEIYNLPLASFTFGKNDDNLLINSHVKLTNNKSNQFTTSTSLSNKFDNNQFQKNEINLNHYNSFHSSNEFSKNLKNENKNIQNNFLSNNMNLNNTNKNLSMSNQIGQFTFGKSNNELNYYIDNDLRNNKQNINNYNNNINIIYKNSPTNNNEKNNDDFNNIKKNRTHSLNNNNNSYINNKNLSMHPIFIVKDPKNPFITVMNNSFIEVIIRAIDNMKLLKRFILSDPKYNFNTNDNNLIKIIHDILYQIGKSKYINIYSLRLYLSEMFKNKGKFQLNELDDPIDVLFLILNSVHNDFQCNLKNNFCFIHQYFWCNVIRKDECGCSKFSKKKFGDYNYIIDIPINPILNFTSQNLLFENYQKIFYYYKKILNDINTTCYRCPINKVKHQFYLMNKPKYFIFNLENDIKKFNSDYQIINILKIFTLISKNFDPKFLFDKINNSNNNNYYDLVGYIFYKISNNFSCAFKNMNPNITNKKGNLLLYSYYENEIMIPFYSYYDLVLNSLKNGIMPICLIYQSNDIINNNCLNYNDNLTNNQIKQLEIFCDSTDNFYKTWYIKIRPKENLLYTNNLIIDKSNKASRFSLENSGYKNYLNNNNERKNIDIKFNRNNSSKNYHNNNIQDNKVNINNKNNNSYSYNINENIDFNNINKKKPKKINHEKSTQNNYKDIQKNSLPHNKRNIPIPINVTPKTGAAKEKIRNIPLTSNKVKINNNSFKYENNHRNINHSDGSKNIFNNNYNMNDNQNMYNIVPSEEVKKRIKRKNLEKQFIENYKNTNNNHILKFNPNNNKNNRHNNNYLNAVKINNYLINKNSLVNKNQKHNISISGNSYNVNNQFYYDKKVNNIINNSNNNIRNTNSEKYIEINNNAKNWKCNFCMNINREDFLYCKICKRNKEGKALRNKTPINSSISNLFGNESPNNLKKQFNNKNNSSNRKKNYNYLNNSNSKKNEKFINTHSGFIIRNRDNIYENDYLYNNGNIINDRDNNKKINFQKGNQTRGNFLNNRNYLI